MKNQIIKKIMAYLLVGAMVITTPMTASANELENAYATDIGEDGKPVNNSNSGTSTSTSTETTGIDLPEEIAKHFPEIIGISLDKTSLEFADLEGNAYLQARALFDDYDAADEEMQWIAQADKEKVEKNINWFSDDYSVATIGTVWDNAQGTGDGSKEKQGPKAEIKPVGEGVTTIYAWIEADGLVYSKTPQRPTPGDYIATATVAVRGQTVSDIDFDDTKVPWVVKRQYDLTKFTTIIFGKDETKKEKTVEQYSGSIVYGITGYDKGTSTASKVKAKATLTDAGILKVTAGNPGEKIKFSITTESGFSKEFSVSLAEPNPVKKLEVKGDKKISLDMGATDGYNPDKERVEKKVEVIVTPNSNTINGGKTTDELIWTSNKKTIADVKCDENDDTKATIYTTGNVGTATITVKATSGKSAKFTVTVTATPDTIELGNAQTYTGKPVTMPVTLKGANGLTVPVGKTKLTYEFINNEEGATAVEAKKYYASINKTKGIVTPKNILSKDGGKTVEDKAPVVLKVRVTGNLKNTSFTNKTADATIAISQSDIRSLTINTTQLIKNKWEIISGAALSATDTKKTLSSLYVGNTYKFEPKVGEGSTGDESSIVWTSTGKGIKSTLTNEGKAYQSEIISNANATIKASYIELKKGTNKTTASKKTKTITLKPIQMAKSLILDKPVQVVNENPNKATTVTIKVKALNPKNSKDTIQWKVLTGKPEMNANGETQSIEGVKVQLSNKYGYVSVDNKVVDKDGTEQPANTKPWNDAKNKTLKVTIPKGTEAGSVIKVGAYAQGGAVAYGYIYVTKPTNSIEAKVGAPATSASKGKNTFDLHLGQNALIETSLKETKNSALISVDDADNIAWSKGDTTAYKREYVTYTLDKKSAQIVRVDKDGNITPLKFGKATITIKTASGKKSAKVVVNVLPPTQNN